MPRVNLSDAVYDRMAQFKSLVEAVSEEALEIDACAEFIIHRGIDLLLAELLGQVGEGALLATIQKLGTRHPAQVYGFLTEVWKLGVDEQKREEVRNQFGFHALMQARRSGSAGQAEPSS
jgi:hypothetical protein